MRRSSALLLTLLALAGCASNGTQAGRLGGPSATATDRTIVRVEVTNIFDRTIDVFTGTEFLGTLAPHAHASYPLAPASQRPRLYARWVGEQRDQQFNISNSRLVHYVYESQTAASR